MKTDSKLFDRIRVKPDPESVRRDENPPCEWQGCVNAGTNLAPKGRHREGQYHRFCMDHVRLYNKTYNYFAGMGDDAVAAYQKDAITGHRPTWTMGVNPWAKKPGEDGEKPSHTDTGEARTPHWTDAPSTPYELFGRRRARAAETHEPDPPRRKLKPMERRSLEALYLNDMASGPEIKARFKELVKRHHPDTNGGDRSTEDRLQEIIQAYNHLKAAGFC